MYDIPCVFCFDAAFARKAAVAITSLCVHADSPYRIYCLVSDVPDDDCKLIEAIARDLIKRSTSSTSGVRSPTGRRAGTIRPPTIGDC
jgi:lipopolysaccharide biosynthesis glycosyltransferase